MSARVFRLSIAMVVAVGALLAAPTAEAYIYWSHSDVTGFVTSIGRAKLDGTGSNPRFIPTSGRVTGMSVSGRHLYWDEWNTDEDEGQIVRASLRGAHATTLVSSTTNEGLATNADHIYFFDDGFLGPSSIGRSDLDGGQLERNYIDGINAPYPCGMAVSRTHVYWAESGAPGTIGRARLDGSDVDQKFIKNVSNSNSCGVAV